MWRGPGWDLCLVALGRLFIHPVLSNVCSIWAIFLPHDQSRSVSLFFQFSPGKRRIMDSTFEECELPYNCIY